MKRIIAFVLLAVMALSLAACQGNTSTTETPSATVTPGGTSTTPAGTEKEPETTTPAALNTPLKAGTYKFTHVGTNYVIKSDKKGNISTADEGTTYEISLDWVVNKEKAYYRIGLYGIETKKHNDKDVKFSNYEVLQNLRLKGISNGSPIETDYDDLNDQYQMWMIVDNGDGTFYVKPRLRYTDRYLTVKDGQMVIAVIEEGGDASSCAWKIEDVSLSNTLYKEFKSEQGRIAVRVPLDVFDSKNYDTYRDPKTLKFRKFVPTEEILVQYANNVENAYFEYIDLTGFVAYYNIFIHAYNYQGVMAGVVGNNNNVFVNCGPGEWFYSDLSKMQYRWEVDGVKDYNFMALHEIGHMFDGGRTWNFESEMQADMKAAYVLQTIDEAFAAPAEYGPEKYFGSNGKDGIQGIAEGYKGLSGGQMSINKETGYGYGYSIYRFAEILTRIIEEDLGWDALKKTFHWFEGEGKAESSKYVTWQKCETWLKKLGEFGGNKDVMSKISAGEMEVLESRFEKQKYLDSLKPAETEEA